MVPSAVALLVLLASGWAQDLNIFILPHSHCDPGWLESFHGYYLRDVRHILTNVKSELLKDSSRKFVWAETSFFQLWYEGLSPAEKAEVSLLVKNNQLEFVGGGWVQHDEASPDYNSIITQLTTGHEYLLRNFGVSPRIGFQIDPFGHSSVTPSLFALAGFDALVINRLHFNLKNQLKENRDMEFIWRGADLGTNTDMLTHVLHTHYSAPAGFDWEEGAVKITQANVNSRAQLFMKEMHRRSQAYQTSNLLVPFGDDFKFKNAAAQFSNMDRLIAHINDNVSGVSIQYATLSEYFQALHRSTPTAFKVFHGDFYPYADNSDSYWTGYFTTRPSMKEMSRQLEAATRAADALYALTRSGCDPSEPDDGADWQLWFEKLQKAREESSLLLHHDAVTGTSRQEVTQDYMLRMHTAASNVFSVAEQIMSHSVSWSHMPVTQLQLVQDTAHSALEEGYHPVVLFNSLAWPSTDVQSISTTSSMVTIRSAQGQHVPCQIRHTWQSQRPSSVSDAQLLVQFVAVVPGLGSTTYFLQYQDSADKHTCQFATTTVFSSKTTQDSVSSKHVKHQELHDSMVLQNSQLKVWLSQSSGLVRSIIDKSTDKEITINQEILEYHTTRGGAYLFRPESFATPVGVDPSTLVVRLTKGSIVHTAEVFWNEYQVLMELPQHPASIDHHVDLEQLCHNLRMTISVIVRPGTELVNRFNTDLSDNGVFHTHNSLEFVPRVRQKVKGREDIPKNFFPMVSGAKLVDQDAGMQLTLTTCHTMAAGSIDEGELELILHRSLTRDDGRGLAQAVQDGSRIEVDFWLSASTHETPLSFRRQSIFINHPVLTFVPRDARQSIPPETWAMKHKLTTSLLRDESGFPSDVHLLSLQRRDHISDEIVIRLHSLQDAAADDFALFKGDLNALFESDFHFCHIVPMSVTLNRALSPGTKVVQRLGYPADDAVISISNAILLHAADNGRAKQHSNEDGVFISAAALAKAAVDNNGNRRLLSASRMEAPVSLERPRQLRTYIFSAVKQDAELWFADPNPLIPDNNDQNRTTTADADAVSPGKSKGKLKHHHQFVPGEGFGLSADITVAGRGEYRVVVGIAVCCLLALAYVLRRGFRVHIERDRGDRQSVPLLSREHKP